MSLSVNIKTDYGAVGDGQLVTRILTIASGSKNLSASANTWSSGDVGKTIVIGGAGASDASHQSIIDTFTDAQHIVIHDNAVTALSSSSQIVAWGTNDSQAFADFNTAGRAASGLVSLAIPAGVYILGSIIANTTHWCRGIPLLEVTGTGLPTLVGNYFLGAFTFPTTNQCSAYIDSALAGQTTVTLKSLADVFKFQVGRQIIQSDGIVYNSGTWIHVTALDMQGFGDPNQFYQEFVEMAGIDAGTGVITLATPLRRNYLDTFPVYNAGAISGPNATDCGGPATIYAFDDSWFCNIQFTGVKFWHPVALASMQCHTWKQTTCTWLDGFGPDPSCNYSWTLDGCDLTPCFTEVDKSVTNMIVKDTTWKTSWFQSASVENYTALGSTFTQSILGTAQNTSLTGCTITALELGPTAYGIANEVRATNCVISDISNVGAIDAHINDPGQGWSLSNGVITYTPHSPVRWAVPGALINLTGPSESETNFRVESVVAGSLGTDVTTTLSGSSFPNVPLQGGTDLGSQVAGPRLYFENCTGCADAIDFSNDGAFGKRYGEYSRRTYSAANLPVSTGPHLQGRIVSVKITVGTAFTTSGALSIKAFGQFSAGALNADNSATTWNLTIDLKTAGVRIVTATTVTGSAGADSLSAPGAIWFDGGPQTPFMSGSITGGDPGSVEIEVIADQGIPDNPNNAGIGRSGVHSRSRF